MVVRHGGDLRQMGDTQDLAHLCHIPQLFRDPLGGPAADAGVHLVKHGGHALLPRAEHGLHGQHDAGKFAAGGHLGQGLQVLAGVGGQQEAHVVGALFGETGLVFRTQVLHFRLKPGVLQVQAAELLFDLPGQPFRRLQTQGVEPAGLLIKGGAHFRVLGLQLVQTVIQVVQ